MRARVAITCAAAALVFAAGDARADDNAARQHFEAGKKLRDEGDCTRAIPEFDRSVAAEKSIGAYYNLGYCHEQLAHRQEAYEAYKNAQQLASQKKDDRLREISGALAALLETPHIRLVLPQPLPPGIEIRVDDLLVPPSVYSAETVIFTKGTKTHTVHVAAPGHEERREVVETKQVKPIELRRAVVKDAPPPPPVVPPPKTETEGGWTWQHWTGLGVAAVGVGLFTIGSVMFISYRIEEPSLLRKYNAAAACTPKAAGSTTICDDAAAEKLRQDLKQQYNDTEQTAQDQTPIMVATAIGGALMIGGGLLLYLTAPKSTAASEPLKGLRVAPMIGGTVQGAALGGTF